MPAITDPNLTSSTSAGHRCRTTTRRWCPPFLRLRSRARGLLRVDEAGVFAPRSAPRSSRLKERLIRFGVALVVLAVVSALFFEVVAGLSPLDAISYVITLLTGAALPADIDPVAANGALRVYAIFLSLVGAAIVAVVYAFITDALIRSRLLQTLGRRTVPSGIHDHVIVAGLGSIGYRVALGIAAAASPSWPWRSATMAGSSSPARAAGIPS